MNLTDLLIAKLLNKTARDLGPVRRDLVSAQELGTLPSADLQHLQNSRLKSLYANNPNIPKGNMWLPSGSGYFLVNSLGWDTMTRPKSDPMSTTFRNYSQIMAYPITDKTPISSSFSLGDYRRATPDMRRAMREARVRDLEKFNK
jgi:hypothetical protein